MKDTRKDPRTCKKIYRTIKAMGETFKTHDVDYKICSKCKDYNSCRAKVWIGAEQKAKGLTKKVIKGR
jgi:hypothetical protein